jgi:general secretion pathway protein A
MNFLDYYGLKEDPFKLTPDPEYFFPSEAHNLALRTLEYSTEQTEGFCLITGEPGTGKTTLLKVFINNWKDRADIALILTPGLSPEDFLSALLEDLGFYIKATNKNELIKAFRDILINRVKEGRKVIIIVDEAQNLPVETLEELRLLSNLETEKEKLLHIVLVGQPELEQKLRSPLLRQLNQRISTRLTLTHLNKKEIREYINFRLLKAGKTFLRFSDSAIKEIHRTTDGNPRLINIVGIRALMCAYLDDSKVVQKKHVKEGIKSINSEEIKRPKRVLPVSAVLAVALILLFLLGLSNMKIISSDRIPFIGSILKGNKGELKEEKKNITLTVPELPKRAETVSEPALQQESQKVYIIVSAWEANLRVAPDLDSDRIGTIRKGVKLPVTGEKIDDNGIRWYRVKVFDNKEAWISEKTVKVVKEEE